MQAKVSQNGELTIVHLIGQINYESVEPLRETCQKRFNGKKLIFNLKGLNFVGSTGITPFIQIIEEIASKNSEGLKLCQVGSEFKKMIRVQEIKGLEIFEEQTHAENSYVNPGAQAQSTAPTVVEELSVAPSRPVILENRPWENHGK